jgi:hypothetical protein
MEPINILIMIHGMSPESKKQSPFEGYDKFWKALVRQNSRLEKLFPPNFTGLDSQPRNFIGVEWGHEYLLSPEPSVDNLREDQRLTRAQNFVDRTIGYNRLRDYKNGSGSDDNNQELIWDFPPGILRPVIFQLREQIITRGLGDVVYYTSEEGECQTRRTVYHQVLSQIAQFATETDVRMHLIGDSLGVTLCHDFLFGIFTRGEESGYIKGKQFYNHNNIEQGENDKKQFLQWYDKARPGVNTLKLGSFTSTASQIPLFLMRKQNLVTQLAKGVQIDASGIGIVDSGRIQWQLFFDVDDLLGFATRKLYNCQQAIREIQVNSGSGVDAHTSYWQNDTVVRETATLLTRNAR